MKNVGMVEWVFIFIVFVIIVFALREFNLWYFKINKNIELQEETNRLLKQLVESKTLAQNEKSQSANKIISTNETSLNDPNVMKKILDNLE